ncbi:MAG: hypothetical protein ACHQK8_07945 [Bacteroidia bacterium]
MNTKLPKMNKKQIMPVMTILFLIFFLNSYSQNNSADNALVKYKGTWEYPGDGQTVSVIISYKPGVKWMKSWQVADSLGEMTFTHDSCMSDVQENPHHSVYTLKDTAVGDNTVGIKKGLAYKDNIFYTMNIKKTVDVFTFISKCEDKNPPVELVFFSNGEGIIIYHYERGDMIYGLTKKK